MDNITNYRVWYSQNKSKNSEYYNYVRSFMENKFNKINNFSDDEVLKTLNDLNEINDFFKIKLNNCPFAYNKLEIISGPITYCLLFLIFVIFVIGLLYLPIAILLWFFVAKDNDISFNLDFKGCNKQYDENILKQSQLIYEQIVKEIIKRRL